MASVQGKPRWTLVEDLLLERFYAEISTFDIARYIGRDVRSVHNRARKLQLSKSADYLRSVNRRNRITGYYAARRTMR